MATQYGGYMGKILQIDLTTETTREYPFTDQQRRETLGGKTLAYHILHKELTGGESPFSEENLVILSTGPLTGTGVPGSVRFDITTLSPKTGLPMSSNCGSRFGLYLKRAGYDALILSGLLCPQDFPGKNTGVGYHAFSRGSSLPRDQTCISYVSGTGRQILYC